MSHTSLVIKDQEVWKKFTYRMRLDGKNDFSEHIFDLIKKDNEEHGDGNPAFTIDHFIENPNFLVCPAVFRDKEAVRNYLLSIRNTPQWKQLGTQLEDVWIQQYNELASTRLL